MNPDGHLALALSDWQRKHNIADGDPMIAVAGHSAPAEPEAAATSLPLTFEEFRATMELLDIRSKAFVSQSTTLIGELRTFAQTVQRLNGGRVATLVMMLMLGLASGLGADWFALK